MIEKNSGHNSVIQSFAIILRECGSTLYVGLAHTAPPTNTNFRLIFFTSQTSGGSLWRHTRSLGQTKLFIYQGKSYKLHKNVMIHKLSYVFEGCQRLIQRI